MLNQNRLFSRLAKYDRAVSEEKIKFAYKFAKTNWKKIGKNLWINLMGL